MIDAERLALAEAFLQEAVFESRAKQAAGTALAAGASAKPTNCGLGREAAIELGLSPRGRELFDALFGGAADTGETGVQREPADPSQGDLANSPDGGATTAARLAKLRDVMSAWIERQDQLDRDRNHFLKAFRQRHGFDRRAYSVEVLAEYDSGLAAINARADAERRAHAQRLLD